MIRLTLSTEDVERLLQGKTVVKHKHMAGTGRAMMQGVVIELHLPRLDVAVVQGTLNRILSGEGREIPVDGTLRS